MPALDNGTMDRKSSSVDTEDDCIMLPCEFCGDLLPAEFLSHHQVGWLSIRRTNRIQYISLTYKRSVTSLYLHTSGCSIYKSMSEFVFDLCVYALAFQTYRYNNKLIFTGAHTHVTDFL